MKILSIAEREARREKAKLKAREKAEERKAYREYIRDFGFNPRSYEEDESENDEWLRFCESNFA